jgi:hypothetical protein
LKIAPTQDTNRTGTLHSWIWEHGIKVGDYWQCNLCPRGNPTRYKCSSTSNPAKHLLLCHNTSKTGEKQSGGQKSIEEGLNMQLINGKVLLEYSIEVIRQILRKLIVNWIIDRRHPLNEIEAESFRKIIEYLN